MGQPGVSLMVFAQDPQQIILSSMNASWAT
jgi:hypothetical protein